MGGQETVNLWGIGKERGAGTSTGHGLCAERSPPRRPTHSGEVVAGLRGLCRSTKLRHERDLRVSPASLSPPLPLYRRGS